MPARSGPGDDRTVGDAPRPVGHDELGVDLVTSPEAVTGRARPVGRVEREVARGRLVEREPAVRAGEMLREGDRLLLAVLAHDAVSRRSRPPRRSAVSIDSVSRWRMPSRRTRRSTTTSIVCCSYRPRSRADRSASSMASPSTLHPGEALLGEVVEQSFVLALAPPHDRGENAEASAFRRDRGPGRRSAEGSGARPGAHSSGSGAVRSGRREAAGSRRSR